MPRTEDWAADASSRGSTARAAGEGPRIIGELGDPSMEQLKMELWPSATSDLVLPTELTSGTIVQFALQPTLRAVVHAFPKPKRLHLAPLACPHLDRPTRSRSHCWSMRPHVPAALRR